MEMNHGAVCICGKRHVCDMKELLLEEHALEKIPLLVGKTGGTKPFLIMDQNTREAAGKRVEALLDGAGISYCAFVFPTKEPIEPTEESVGKVMMAWDPSCDIILAIGSGVINDISKFVSRVSGHPYLLVLTAPSMDGIVSPSSSMSVVGLKVSLPSAVVHTVVGDLGVLSHAPERMILSGYGDMLAKYISTLEWRISNLINGEYYCPEIDGMMQEALKRVGKSADGLISRDMRSVREETDGLVLAGCAMAYAGVTRPASGMEHYISHVMDMRHLAFGTPADFHGIQVGVATLVSLRVYEELEKIESVDVEEALRYVRDFNVDDWFRTLRGFIGPAAEGMIAVEAHDHKYDKASHGKRIVRIAELWPDLRKLMVDRLPSSTVLEAQMKKLGMPTSLTELGVKKSEIPVMIKCTKDIRDKYVGTRLLWDLGLLDEVVETVTARSV